MSRQVHTVKPKLTAIALNRGSGHLGGKTRYHPVGQGGCGIRLERPEDLIPKSPSAAELEIPSFPYVSFCNFYVLARQSAFPLFHKGLGGEGHFGLTI